VVATNRTRTIGSNRHTGFPFARNVDEAEHAIDGDRSWDRSVYWTVLRQSEQFRESGETLRGDTDMGESRNRSDSLLKTPVRCHHEPSHVPTTDGIRDQSRAFSCPPHYQPRPLNGRNDCWPSRP